MKKVLFVASEATPFIKTGGLADVIGSLPKYFNKEEYDVRIFLPNYLCIPEEWKEKCEHVGHFYVNLSWRSQYAGILTYVHEGVTYYLIDNEFYFAGYGPYGNIYEDVEKFAYFCKAVLEALPLIDFQPDIIHCHDWQTGLIPVFLDYYYRKQPFYAGMKTVMTIHNLKFQGCWDINTVSDITGLPRYYFVPDKLESFGESNYLKGGIVYADAVTTVSKTYAEEVKTPFYGERLDGLMRARSNVLRGILNGIDYEVFSPAEDNYIYKKYDARTFRKEKIKNKRKLQEELGLERNDKAFLIGIVSRLTEQKGMDLIAYIMDELCQENVQIVALGTGEERFENMLRHFAWKYNGKVSANIYYSEALSHKIYAASDAFLMPSLFEPCGLSQLMSLRYGTVPIVRETGGLKDTVEPYDEFKGTGTGFSFQNYNAHDMLYVIRYAMDIFHNKKREWNKIIDRAMAADFSWAKSAREYEEMYDWLINQ